MDKLIPSWISNVTLQMDNAGTNKNRFLFYALAGLVKLGRFLKIDISFMYAGHTKVSCN